MAPYVSVLIDTYNHERFIEQAVASVLEQDFPAAEREIIVVDDGSTDGTREVLRRFGSQIRVLRKTNGGQASAFNAGIPECRGQIVAFLDGDDWWAPGKLCAVSEALSRDAAAGAVGHGIIEAFDDGREQSQILSEGWRFQIDSVAGAKVFRLRKSFLGTSRLTARTELMRRVLPVPESLRIEADEYLFTLAACSGPVVILREALTFYRLHGGNLFQYQGNSATATRRKKEVLAALVDALRESMPKFGAPPAAVRATLEVLSAEVQQMKLALDGGLPWQTVTTEWKLYRIMQENSSWTERVFRAARLLPAAFLPPRRYYSVRKRIAGSSLYRKARGAAVAAPELSHIDRSWKQPS